MHSQRIPSPLRDARAAICFTALEGPSNAVLFLGLFRRIIAFASVLLPMGHGRVL